MYHLVPGSPSIRCDGGYATASLACLPWSPPTFSTLATSISSPASSYSLMPLSWIPLTSSTTFVNTNSYAADEPGGPGGAYDGGGDGDGPAGGGGGGGDGGMTTHISG